MLDLDMGQYAQFVWPAFAITALGFGWMIADSLARARRWKADVERLSGKTNP
jgi:heme exporter protein D